MTRTVSVIATALVLVAAPQPLSAASGLERSKIVYSSWDPFVQAFRVWAANPDGSARRVIAGGLQPDLSPDRTKVAVTSFKDYEISNDSDVFVTNLDGSPNRARAVFAAYPAWSPDGSRIAYVAFLTETGEVPKDDEDYTQSEIFVMNRDGSNKTNLTRDPARLIYYQSGYLDASSTGYLEPQWSPDGSRIAFAKPVGEEFAIFVMNADGSDQTQLTDPGFTSPTWSPDGTRLAFVRHSAEGETDAELFIMDADGTDPVQITDNSVNDLTPEWGPGGTMYYSSYSSDFLGLGIYVRKLGSEGRRRLTCDPDLSAFEPVVPSGRWKGDAAGPRRSSTTVAVSPRGSRSSRRMYISLEAPSGPCDFPRDTCIAGRRVAVRKERSGTDRVVRRLTTDRDGVLEPHISGRGRFYAIARTKTFTSPEGRSVMCGPDRSNTIRL